MHPSQPIQTAQRTPGFEPTIRSCGEDEMERMLAIINSAAEAYRGAIPADCWREPYMSLTDLQAGIADGIAFVGCELDGVLVGVMGVQPARNADLIRHAYVLPAFQGRGVGAVLMKNLRARSSRQTLVGTWAAAIWAIEFYQRRGFQLVSEAAKALLLRTYWKIPERQAETSVVLAVPHLSDEKAGRLVECG